MNANPFSGAQMSLPLYIYRNYQLGLPVPLQRAWTAALVLITLVVVLFSLARVLGSRDPHGRASFRGRSRGPRDGSARRLRGAPMSVSAIELERPEELGTTAASLEAVDVSAWFGDHKVLERVSLRWARTGHRADRPVGLRQVDVPADPQPHARAGAGRRRWPARCGSTATTSTARRSASTDIRRRIGMVFQKPNPFPAMSISDNVLAGSSSPGTQGRADARRARRGVPAPAPGCGTR